MPRPRRLRRLLTRSLIALAALVSTVLLTATPASAAPPNYYMAARANTSACIDVAAENGHFVQIWRCTQGAGQTWRRNFSQANNWYQFQNGRFGNCLGAVHIGQNVTGAVRAITCTDVNAATPWDKWGVEFAANSGGWYQVWYSLADATQCLTRLGGTANGTEIGLQPCDRNDARQQWRLLDT